MRHALAKQADSCRLDSSVTRSKASLVIPTFACIKDYMTIEEFQEGKGSCSGKVARHGAEEIGSLTSYC